MGGSNPPKARSQLDWLVADLARAQSVVVKTLCVGSPNADKAKSNRRTGLPNLAPSSPLGVLQGC